MPFKATIPAAIPDQITADLNLLLNPRWFSRDADQEGLYVHMLIRKAYRYVCKQALPVGLQGWQRLTGRKSLHEHELAVTTQFCSLRQVSYQGDVESEKGVRKSQRHLQGVGKLEVPLLGVIGDWLVGLTLRRICILVQQRLLRTR